MCTNDVVIVVETERERSRAGESCGVGGWRGVEEGGFAVDGGFGRERRFWCAVVGDTSVTMHATYLMHWSDGRGELLNKS